MTPTGFRRPPEEYYRNCPFCQSRLSLPEYMRRKTIKICKCDKCGKLINDKIIKF
jgi:ribosomal protein L37AE/L43A